MKLMSGKVAPLASELVDELIKSKNIEVESEEVPEVQLDLESVLKEYIRSDREVTEKARDLIARQKRDYGDLSKVKTQIARERGFGVGDNLIEYVTAQLIEALIHSRHVEEVYGMDNDLVVIITPILKKHLAADEELDQEVRKRIKNLQEGTITWDAQYQKLKDEMKKVRRLDE
jgi:hypothetical protein